MKIIAKIGDCVVEVDDRDGKEPASLRWSDQFERAVIAIKEVQNAVIALHEQQIKDL